MEYLHADGLDKLHKVNQKELNCFEIVNGVAFQYSHKI